MRLDALRFLALFVLAILLVLGFRRPEPLDREFKGGRTQPGVTTTSER